MPSKVRKLFIFGFLILCSAAYAKDEIKWVTDLEEAKEIASKENKKIFILFTNSHTCVPCKKFKKTVIENKKFSDYAGENLVLLLVDYASLFTEKKKIGDIEKLKKIPQKMANKGRGPWPYLFVLSNSGEELYSGVANDPKHPDVKKYLTFLKSLK